MDLSEWVYPRDGDIIITEEFFIFYVMGYDHPKDRVISYLKYIPVQEQKNFELDWISHEWQLSGRRFVRPKMLYSPKIFRLIEGTFRENYPDYLYSSKHLGKTVFAIPFDKIKMVYIPKNGLKRILNLDKNDPLQTQALKLIQLLSDNSKVNLSYFGIHGSLLTSMHSNTSDIDLAIYGAKNFLKVKETVKNLEKKGKIEYLNEIQTDLFRKNKGIFDNRKFVFNAIRDKSEVKNKYNLYEYSPIKSIQFTCKIANDSESIFRPAHYKIKDYKALNKDSNLFDNQIPNEVVSMIGEFRDVVHNGEIAKVSGMLEIVKNLKTKKVRYRVVVGSGTGVEFILPADS
ncbi:MAG: hypothetical protein ACTSRG_16725 [Candidatus Helarchaeota archaeon]